MSSDERTKTVRHLRAAEGHLRAIIVLVGAGAPCRQALSQLRALQAELQSLKLQLLKCQVSTSKNVIQYDPCVDHRIAELQRLVDLFTIRIRSL